MPFSNGKLKVEALVDGEWKDITAHARPIAWEVDVEGQGTGVLVSPVPGEGTVVGDLTAHDLARVWDGWLRGSTWQSHFGLEPATSSRVVAEEIWPREGRRTMCVGGVLFDGVTEDMLVALLREHREEQ